jgi:DNA-directed RNA polymerase subunit RPC12/RpoP
MGIMRCPQCGDELRRSKKDPSYGLCDNCRKKFKWVDDDDYEDDYEEEDSAIKCPKCRSKNVNVQMVTESNLKKKNGCLYWIVIGWWWEPIMWLSFFIPMLIYKLFRPKKYVMKSKHHSMYVCQNCGYSWKA